MNGEQHYWEALETGQDQETYPQFEDNPMPGVERLSGKERPVPQRDEPAFEDFPNPVNRVGEYDAHHNAPQDFADTENVPPQTHTDEVEAPDNRSRPLDEHDDCAEPKNESKATIKAALITAAATIIGAIIGAAVASAPSVQNELLQYMDRVGNTIIDAVIPDNNVDPNEGIQGGNAIKDFTCFLCIVNQGTFLVQGVIEGSSTQETPLPSPTLTATEPPTIAPTATAQPPSSTPPDPTIIIDPPVTYVPGNVQDPGADLDLVRFVSEEQAGGEPQTQGQTVIRPPADDDDVVSDDPPATPTAQPTAAHDPHDHTQKEPTKDACKNHHNPSGRRGCDHAAEHDEQQPEDTSYHGSDHSSRNDPAGHEYEQWDHSFDNRDDQSSDGSGEHEQEAAPPEGRQRDRSDQREENETGQHDERQPHNDADHEGERTSRGSGQHEQEAAPSEDRQQDHSDQHDERQPHDDADHRNEGAQQNRHTDEHDDDRDRQTDRDNDNNHENRGHGQRDQRDGRR